MAVSTSLPVASTTATLHAGAQAGVQPHGGARAGGGGQQQVVQVAGEHVDGLVLGLLAQLG